MQNGRIIPLQRIYNFLLFHGIILSILDTSYVFLCYFISFFGTNLLAQCLVQLLFSACFWFFGKSVPNRVPTLRNFLTIFFWTKESLKASGGDQRTNEETARQQGMPSGSHPVSSRLHLT